MHTMDVLLMRMTGVHAMHTTDAPCMHTTDAPLARAVLQSRL